MKRMLNSSEEYLNLQHAKDNNPEVMYLILYQDGV